MSVTGHNLRRRRAKLRAILEAERKAAEEKKKKKPKPKKKDEE